MKTKTKRAFTGICIVIALIFIWLTSSRLIENYRINRIPQMPFNDILLNVTKNNKEAKITIGIIEKGKESYTVYGEKGIEKSETEYVYEIGSITKTFTANLIIKAVIEGKINLNAPIDKYIKLPHKAYYPTIKRLITHTSGYKGYCFEKQMLSNFLNNRNIFGNISKEQLIKRIGETDLKNQDYDFNYSNFGFAVLGVLLSEIYNADFPTLVNNYLKDELKLKNTHISTGSGNLGNYWNWNETDAYMAAGALTSTIGDMLKYCQMQLNENAECLPLAHHILAKTNSTSERNLKMNIHADFVGAAWIIDKQNNIIWHNGATGNYSCYMGFNPDKEVAVVVLTNLPADYYIPSFATVMGVKLLTELPQK